MEIEPTLQQDRLKLYRFSEGAHVRDFIEAVQTGLSDSPKWLPPKFFYDERGSELFEQITQTPEYYPTRTAALILDRFAPEILDAAGNPEELLELGSGSSAKTRLLLDLLTRRQGDLEYTAIDISPTIVAENGAKLLEDYPDLTVRGLIGDYHQAMEALRGGGDAARLFLFLGSSLGNYSPGEAQNLLAEIGAAMGDADRLLLGLDLKKEKAVLEAAYNDARGVTAAFNLNVLAHINAALGGDFDLEGFSHRAFFNEAESRIEMHLVSGTEQTVRVEAAEMDFSFQAGETIHTENSCKYDGAALDRLYEGTGLARVGRWNDPRKWFALDLLAPTGA